MAEMQDICCEQVAEAGPPIGEHFHGIALAALSEAGDGIIRTIYVRACMFKIEFLPCLLVVD